MIDYKHIVTSEPKVSLATMILEGLGFVLAFLMIMVLLAVASVL